MDLDQLRATTGQLLDLAGAHARRRAVVEPARRRRKRARLPFSVTVRVDLVDAKPPVWRRLRLPSTLRLDELHGVLQAVFGWTDGHLHRFSLGDSAWDHDSERFLCPHDVEDGETTASRPARSASTSCSPRPVSCSTWPAPARAVGRCLSRFDGARRVRASRAGPRSAALSLTRAGPSPATA